MTIYDYFGMAREYVVADVNRGMKYGHHGVSWILSYAMAIQEYRLGYKGELPPFRWEVATMLDRAVLFFLAKGYSLKKSKSKARAAVREVRGE